MALLRRSISTLVARVVGGQRFGHTAAAASYLSRQTNAYLLPPWTGFTSRRNYSDKKLLEAVNSEIQSTLVLNQQYKPVEAPEGFPFEIKEEPWRYYLTLVREYKGDTVSVIVALEDPDGEEKSSHSRLPLDVIVHTVDDTWLELQCTVLSDKITIDSVDMITPGVAYTPPLKDMGKDLQEAFQEYLELREINMSTANFLREYITNYFGLNKENREYLSWLKGVKHLFVRA